MTGIVALYIFMLAAFTGYEVIARVPVILHTPLMSGSNFVHGIVLVGAMVALGAASPLRRSASSACCSRPAMRWQLHDRRMLEMFKSVVPGAADRRGALDVGRLSADLRSRLPPTAFLFIMGLKRIVRR